MKNITLIVTLFLLLCGCSKDKTNGIEARTVTNTDFADPLLYIYMQNKYDTNKDYTFQPEEVMAVTSVDLSKKNNFASLKGLELFVNLEVLNLAGQRPTDKNLKLTNPKLWSLNCSDMNLSSIDITALTELTELDCSKNIRFDELDLSKNTKLKVLTCDEVTVSGGVFKQLDLSNNPELEKMVCRNTSINLINLSNCKKLKYLDCYETSLKSIDLNDCTLLEYLDLSATLITALNVNNCSALKYLNMGYSDLESLNIENNVHLEELIFNGDRMETLDMSNNPKLSKITFKINSSKKHSLTIYIKQGQTKPTIEQSSYEGGFSYDFKYK